MVVSVSGSGDVARVVLSARRLATEHGWDELEATLAATVASELAMNNEPPSNSRPLPPEVPSQPVYPSAPRNDES